jgi:hypothetical protein
MTLFDVTATMNDARTRAEIPRQTRWKRDDPDDIWDETHAKLFQTSKARIHQAARREPGTRLPDARRVAVWWFQLDAGFN